VDKDGNLDMREFFNTTTKAKHTSLNILKFVKNIFLLNTYLKIETSNNKDAGKLFNSNYEEFKVQANSCVKTSIEDKYKYEGMEDFTIKFSEFDSVHEKILNNLKERPEETLNEKVIGF